MNNRIKEIRKSRNMTQKELAIECNVSRQTINMIENDKYDPSLKLAFSLSKALDTEIEKIFIYKE